MIARVGIQKGEDLATQGGVDYLVYARQRKVILRTRFVEASIINAHSPFLSILFNKNRIGKPVRVEYLFDKSSYQEFGNLIAYSPMPFIVEMMQALLRVKATYYLPRKRVYYPLYSCRCFCLHFHPLDKGANSFVIKKRWLRLVRTS